MESKDTMTHEEGVFLRLIRIYKITNSKTEDLYVGRTSKSLQERMGGHRSNCDGGGTMPVHVKMREIGIEHFSITQVAKSWCSGRRAAAKLEQKYIDLFKPNLNKNRAYQSYEERKDYNRGLYWKNKDAVLKQRKEYYEKHKPEILEDRKEYYEKHKPEIRAKQKVYYETHKEQIAAQTKGYREEHKEEIRKKKKEHYEEHKDDILARNKKYREANKEKIASINKKYREANRDKLLEKERKRNAEIVASKRFYCQDCDYAAPKQSALDRHHETEKHKRAAGMI